MPNFLVFYPYLSPYLNMCVFFLFSTGHYCLNNNNNNNNNNNMRLDDEAVRVAVGMRLGVSLYVPDAVVVPRLMHRHATPWSAEKHQAELPQASCSERYCLVSPQLCRCSIHKRADRLMQTKRQMARPLSLIPWQNGKPLV